MKNAISDWKCKWAPAIQVYADGVSAKAARLAVENIKEMYPNGIAIYL